MADRTPEQLADQTRLCRCNHLKNTHANGEGKCLFAQLQAAYGYPDDPECPCQMFIEDTARTEAYRAELERMRHGMKGIVLDRPIT